MFTGQDFTLLRTSFTFDAATSSLVVPIGLVNNDVAESSENIVLCLPEDADIGPLAVVDTHSQCSHILLVDDDGRILKMQLFRKSISVNFQFELASYSIHLVLQYGSVDTGSICSGNTGHSDNFDQDTQYNKDISACQSHPRNYSGHRYRLSLF